MEQRHRFAVDLDNNLFLIPDTLYQEFHAHLAFPNEQRRRLFNQYSISKDSFVAFTFLDPQEDA